MRGCVAAQSVGEGRLRVGVKPAVHGSLPARLKNSRCSSNTLLSLQLASIIAFS